MDDSIDEQTKVWDSTPETMRKNLEDKLDKLIEQSDENQDGLIDREEFKNIIIIHFKHRIRGNAQLGQKDLNRLEKQAVKMFKKFDKDKNRVLDKNEVRKYLLKQINNDEEEDLIEENLTSLFEIYSD